MAGTPVNPTTPLSAQNAPVGTGIAPVAASHPGFVRDSPSGELKSIGGGGASAPLSNVLYADKGAIDSSGDGSIGAPFKTLTAAVAAGNALGVTSVTILLTPYDYTSEPALTTGAGVQYNFIGLGGGTDENSARIPDVNAGGDCYFENVFQGSLNGLTVIEPGFIEVVYNNSSGLGVTGIDGETLRVLVNGFSTSFDPNSSNAKLNGPVLNAQVLQLNGATIVATGITSTVDHLTLRNGSVATLSALNCANIALYSGSHLTINTDATGDGTGKIICEDSLVIGNFAGFLSTSVFRGAKFGVTTLAFPCSMDIDSYFGFFAAGGNTTSVITSLTAGEPSCRVPRGDNSNPIDMNGQGKIVLPANVLTADRSCQLSTSDSLDKQLIIFDSFAHEGFKFAIIDGATAATLYTFNNGVDAALWRATFIVTSRLGNTFALFSVEPIIWV